MIQTKRMPCLDTEDRLTQQAKGKVDFEIKKSYNDRDLYL